MKLKKHQPFTRLKENLEDHFGGHNASSWTGDCLIGKNVGIPRFDVWLREDDFDTPVLEVAGGPDMGKTRLLRRVMLWQLDNPNGHRLVVIETQKRDNLDLACRSSFLYFDHLTFRHNHYILLPPTMAQAQSLIVADRKADTYGLHPGTGAHILYGIVSNRLYQGLNRTDYRGRHFARVEAPLRPEEMAR